MSVLALGAAPVEPDWSSGAVVLPGSAVAVGVGVASASASEDAEESLTEPESGIATSAGGPGTSS